MQQKVNLVELLVNGELIVLKDVDVIETEDGIYVEDTFKLGTDNEGEDLIQKRLTFYPSSKVLKMVWSENALVDTVKENVMAEIIRDHIESLSDFYEEEIEDSGPDQRDNPEFNPYDTKKED